MYDALLQVYPYFMKAYELDQLPNEKGKVKPKHTKNIKSILATDHLSYFNGGAYYFGVKDSSELITGQAADVGNSANSFTD